MTGQLVLGAPGVYRLPATPVEALMGVRMDVCGFVGVAPRGPSRTPVVGEYRGRVWAGDGPLAEPDRPRLRSVAVAVESWSEYRRLFGSFEGNGLLPHAVASFFEQGGRRAYVVRIVHDYDRPGEDSRRNCLGVAYSPLVGVRADRGGPVTLIARNEGTWGNRLRAELTFRAFPIAFEGATTTEFVVADDAPVGAGTLIRLTYDDGTRALRLVTSSVVRDRPGPGRERVLVFELAASAVPASAEVVEGVLEVVDTDPLVVRRERHERLGLSSEHPRWLATVLAAESELIWPAPSWAGGTVRPADATLPPAVAAPFRCGEDRSPQIVAEDFFDDDWVPQDQDPAAGVHALLNLADLSLVVVPDLYAPAPPVEREVILDTGSAGGCFVPCVDTGPPVEQEAAAPGLDGLRLDPTIPTDLEVVVGLQRRLADLADKVQSFVVLFDVPPGLHHRQILRWRTSFATAFAAAYHPWLTVTEWHEPDETPRRPGRLPLRRPMSGRLHLVNPSAVAAGIVARREGEFGVPFGPANELARGVVGALDPVSTTRHDELHPAGINVYLQERDGIRLTAARTLSVDPAYRQLSVRRLMTMLARSLDQEMQWLVFEPNDEPLRTRIRLLLVGFLRTLYQAGAFRGATEDEAFFVRCDESLNPRRVVDAGQLVVEIGVAPAEPLEFLVLVIVRDGDGTLRVEGRRG